MTAFAGITRADLPPSELAKIFPVDVGGFHQTRAAKPLTTLISDGLLRAEYFPINPEPKASQSFVGGETEYTINGVKLLVEVVRFQIDSEAYSLLTLQAKKSGKDVPAIISIGDIGTVQVTNPQGVAFVRGSTFIRVTSETADNKAAIDFARLFAPNIDKGEDDIPVLVKHLPDWQKAQPRAMYAVSAAALREVIANRPVLDAVSFEGGTEAVVANYGQSQLVIVEFTTPQFSIDNDQRIWTKIGELKSRGEPVPTAYRRVGNYSVFVFNAPDENVANALVDQVKYEKIVQWLGEDPHLSERLQKYFRQTSAGVLVAVLKSSGLSLLLCLAAGALIGTMMFRHRRAQKAAAYSDAGGSIRLNLDELTGPVSSQRLLKSARPVERNSADS